jgi:hypothetical protein
MPTTTPEAIRNAMSVALMAVEPESYGHVKFRQHRHERGVTFREWAMQNPQGCERKFSIRSIGGASAPETSGGDVEWVEQRMECVVAYPRDWNPGSQGNLDLDDLISADARLVVKTIGTVGYQTLEASVGSAAASVTHDRDDREVLASVVLLVVPLTAQYYRSLTSTP